MKRIQLFEFEDQFWFPGWLRTSITNLIVVFNRMLGIDEVIATILERVLKEKNVDTIVDLGSGAGGAMPDVLHQLREVQGLENTRLILTDLFPNEDALKKFNQDFAPQISYNEQPVDAIKLDKAPAGIKTMINCFHHMPADKARAILQSAADNKEPLLIYELGDNKLPLAVWWLFLPLSLVILFIMVLFMTPFVRPLTLRQIFFTYIIPLIPLTYAWDGQASLPRIYTLDDLGELLDGINVTGYKWQKGYGQNKKGKKQGIFLLGLPE